MDDWLGGDSISRAMDDWLGGDSISRAMDDWPGDVSEQNSRAMDDWPGDVSEQNSRAMDDWPDDVSEHYDIDDFEVDFEIDLEEPEIPDRLSELPDSLIFHILSFLPMRDVVRTTLLSKRWKSLWTTVPSLNFIGDVEAHTLDDVEEDPVRFRNFINRALMLWKGTRILTFKINLGYDESLDGDIDSWVYFAKENKVEDLCIHLAHYGLLILYIGDTGVGTEEVLYWLPQCLYSCSSIRKLSLVGCHLQIDGTVHWNQLTSLRIDGFCIREHVINQIMSGAPQLEVFTLRLKESFENLNIESSSLKKLTIDRYVGSSDDDPSIDRVLRIWCPNLEALNISRVLYRKCLLMNVSSLTDATLGFCNKFYRHNGGFSWEDLLGETLGQILPTIQHVQKVTLSSWCIQVLGTMEKKYVCSPMSNVKCLKLDVDYIKLNEVVNLLGIFPKLKMLVIEDTTNDKSVGVNYRIYNYKNEIQKQYTEPLEFDAENYLELRTVDITWFLFETSIFPFIEFLLKHASMLEKMVIQAKGIMSLPPEFLFLASDKLLSMPRSSPTAKVLLQSSEVSKVLRPPKYFPWGRKDLHN